MDTPGFPVRFGVLSASRPSSVRVAKRQIFLAAAFCLMASTGVTPGAWSKDAGPDGPWHAVTAAGTSSRRTPTTYGDSIVVAASPERVWRVLTDYDHMQEFIPGMDRCHMVKDSMGTRIVEQSGSSGWFLFKVRERALLRIREHECTRIDFNAIAGDFDVLEGWWSLHPEDGGDATTLKYSVDVQPSFHCPGFLTEFFVRHGLRARLLALQARATRGSVRPASVARADQRTTGRSPTTPTVPTVPRD